MKTTKKRKKRANGEGTIRKLKDGRWEARITDGYTLYGKQHFKTFSRKTQGEVKKWLDEQRLNNERFSSNNVIKYTMKEWLIIWYDTYVINNVKISTRTSYEGIIKNHLIPYIGHIKLIELKKVDIERMYMELIKNDTKKKKLSVKSIRNIHLVLHKALQEALQREYIAKNPASIANVPTLKSQNVKKKEIEIYTKEEQEKLIKVSQVDDIYGSLVIFALYSGMRKGEILGLQWNDIDFNSKTINVNKQLRRIKNYDTNIPSKTLLRFEYNTKTSNSTRKVPMMNCLEQSLKEHYNKQLENKKIFKKEYNKTDMVFCRPDGTPLDPDTVLSKYYKLSENAGIKKCTFHALRHTFATRALESGVTAKVVSKILGHSSVEFTLNTYTHTLPEIQKSEMEKLNNYLNN